MKKINSLGLVLVSISLSCITFSSLSLIHKNQISSIQVDAAAQSRTLTCSNFSQFVSRKYLTTKNGNKIKFSVSGCSGSTISLGGTFYNTTKFAKITGITVNFNSPYNENLICYYGNSSNPKNGTGSNFALQSGYKQTLNTSYIEITNLQDFNNGAMTISSFTIYYTC